MREVFKIIELSFSIENSDTKKWKHLFFLGGLGEVDINLYIGSE